MVKGTVGAVKGAADWVFDVALGTDAERAAAWNSAASFVRETAETVKVMVKGSVPSNDTNSKTGSGQSDEHH